MTLAAHAFFKRLTPPALPDTQAEVGTTPVTAVREAAIASLVTQG